MVSKKTKESKEYQNQQEQAAKQEGEIEEITLNNKQKEQEKPITMREIVINMSDTDFKLFVIETLDHILEEINKKNDTETQQ